MTRKQALAELIAKVEAGNFDETDTTPAKFNAFMRLAEDVLPLDVRFLQGKAWQAYNGSLDAAKSLMMSMLPGPVPEKIHSDARKELLSILKALHSMEADT